MKSKNLKILILILLVIILFCIYRKNYILENFRTIDINDGQYTKIIIEDDFNYPEEEDENENKEVVDMSDYILKSSIPPPPKMPNMNEYIHKSKLTNKQKDLLDNSNKYILKNKCNTEEKSKKGKKDLQKPKKGKPIISQKKDLPKSNQKEKKEKKDNDKKLYEEQNKKVINEEENKKNKSIFNSLINWFKNLFGIKNIENFTSDIDIVKYDYPIDIIEVHDNTINEKETETETINSFNNLMDNYILDDYQNDPSFLSLEEEHNKKITSSLLSELNNKRFLYN